MEEMFGVSTQAVQIFPGIIIIKPFLSGHFRSSFKVFFGGWGGGSDCLGCVELCGKFLEFAEFLLTSAKSGNLLH